jgi:hypothetical protein
VLQAVDLLAQRVALLPVRVSKTIGPLLFAPSPRDLALHEQSRSAINSLVTPSPSRVQTVVMPRPVKKYKDKLLASVLAIN